MKIVQPLLLLVICAPALAADPVPDAQKADAQQTANSASESAKPAADATQPSTASRQPSGKRTNDRLELDTTVVTGNRELPKVMYIVPWKKADIGDLPAQPFNTLIDEALTPVDRDVFRREVTYYGAVSAGADRTNPASSMPATSPEK
jgi:hypothetical protein